MLLRKISGKQADFNLFKEWINKKHAEIELLTSFIFKTPFCVYQFIAEDAESYNWMPSEISDFKFSRIHYYELRTSKDKIFLHWSCNGSIFPLPSFFKKSSSIGYSLYPQLIIQPQYYLLEQTLIATQAINCKKRNLLQEVNTTLYSKDTTISDLIDSLNYNEITKNKLKELILPKGKIINFRAISSFFNLYPEFNLDTFFAMQKKPTLIFINEFNNKDLFPLTKTLSLLNQAVLRKEPYALIKDVAQQLVSCPEIHDDIKKIRIRNFRHLSSVTTALINELGILNNAELAVLFSNQQKKMQNKQKENFIIPQNILELKQEAKKIKNCAITYGNFVVQKNTFIGFYYKNNQSYACLLFDPFFNLLEISGIQNKKLSESEVEELTHFVQRL